MTPEKDRPNCIRVRAATTANIAIVTALNAGDTIDGLTLADGMLVLVKDQTAPAENGIYVVAAVPHRHEDFSTAFRNLTAAYDQHCGLIVVVEQGDTVWNCTSNRGGTLGTTALAFAVVAETLFALGMIGTIVATAVAAAPAGWLLCFGQAVSRTTYARLFAAIGTVGGAGDGSTTFNIPDLRGRTVAGQDDMGGSSANRLTSPINGDTLGAAGGAEGVTLTDAQVPNTDIRVFDGGSSYPLFGLGGQTTGGYFGRPGVEFPNSSVTGNLGSAAEVAGGGGAHANVQPTIILNYMIFAGV